MKKVLSLVGARPQFIKEALVGKAAREAGLWQHRVVHSGQHYDAALSDIFFEELRIPEPDYHLGIGSGSHASMTAAALIGMENVLHAENPDALMVYGDTIQRWLARWLRPSCISPWCMWKQEFECILKVCRKK